MSEIKKCPNCNTIEARGGRFCSQCGHDLAQIPRRDYGALRFTSSMIVLFGWVIIVISLFSSAYYYSQYAMSGDAIIRQSDVPSYDPNKVVSPLVPVGIALFGVTSGTITIAAGQVIMVIIDIRDDVRKMTLQ